MFAAVPGSPQLLVDRTGKPPMIGKLLDWVSPLVWWTHAIAGIAWIGYSFRAYPVVTHTHEM
jgi:hypothetical protein